jgi:hypothetical protein
MKTVLAPGAPWYKNEPKKRAKPPQIDENFRKWLQKEGFVMTDEDDEFARIEREASMGWRKQHIEQKKELDPYRNLVLEEVALEFEKLVAFGDTAASFAMFVRNMKR